MQEKYVGQFDKERYSGDVIHYYPNGNKKSQGSYLMKNIWRKPDQRTGAWTEWHENGKKKWTGSYIKGERKGICSKYYESGQLEREALFEKDVIVGFVREFYEDGTKKIDGNFCSTPSRRGMRCGEWKVWDETGNLVKDEVYDKGRKVE